MQMTRSPRPWRGRLASLLPLCLLAVLTMPIAQETPATSGENPTPYNPLTSEKADLLLGALEDRSELVDLLLMDTSREYRRVAVAKAAAMQELIDVQAKLDREAVRVRDLTIERLGVVYEQREKVAQRYRSLERESDRLIDSLRSLLKERDTLARRIADMRSSLPLEEEMISGVWEVTWLPAGISGTFYLDQSGTLVTGQYRLGSLGSGSLRGTFVGSKLYLERVDSERGRDAELEGYLDPDGTRIRGTWQAFELVQGGLPHGQWVARRVE